MEIEATIFYFVLLLFILFLIYFIGNKIFNFNIFKVTNEVKEYKLIYESKIKIAREEFLPKIDIRHFVKIDHFTYSCALVFLKNNKYIYAIINSFLIFEIKIEDSYIDEMLTIYEKDVLKEFAEKKLKEFISDHNKYHNKLIENRRDEYL